MTKSRYLSFDDFNKIVESVPTLSSYHSKNKPKLNPEQLQLLCKLLFYCALKIDEALSLTKSDLQLDEKLINVKSKKLVNQTTIPTIILPQLTIHIKNLKEDQKLFDISRQHVWRIIKELGKLSGVKMSKIKQGKIDEGINPMLFRQSYKQYMMNQGADEDLSDLKLRLKKDTHSRSTIKDLLKWEKNFYKIRFYTEEEIKEFSKKFMKNRTTYENLSQKVHDILKEITGDKKIEIHSITPRTKSIESFESKIRNGIGFQPLNMQDLSAVRIICYVRSDVEQVSKIIEDNFKIDPQRSYDKSEILGENVVGYSSVHYVGKFTDSRTSLEEFKKFRDMYFEIQVRTILQHAWAEIEHDRMYKRKNLPTKLRRRFNLVSGLLEIADNEFQNLHNEGEGIS